MFATEKWCDAKPNSSPTCSFHHLFGSFGSTRMGDCSLWFFEENEGHTDENLESACAQRRPDLLVAQILPGYAHNMSPECLGRIRDSGVPVAMIWVDSVHPGIIYEANRYLPCVTKSFLCDSTSDGHIPMWYPDDSRMYRPRAFTERDIFVSFIGSSGGAYRERADIIRKINERGVAIHCAGGQREDNLPFSAIADLYCRSQFTINFSRTASGLWQRKARMFESLYSGACLLNQQGPISDPWLEAWRDFIPWKTVDDLIDILGNHRDSGEQIAKNGLRTVTEKYNAISWWELVVAHCGVMSRRSTTVPS